MPIIHVMVTCLSPLAVHDERACIPAALLKGRLRAEVERLAQTFDLRVCESPERATMCHPDYERGVLPCIACQLFGSPWNEGALYFDDLMPTTPTTLIQLTRTAVPRSRRRGLRLNADERAVDALPTGTILSGRIRHGLPDLSRLGLTVIGLRAITQFGGGGGVGWGACQVDAQALGIDSAALAEAFQRDFVK